MKFKKTEIAKLVAEGRPCIHWDDDLAGFGLKVYRRGVASYVVDFRLKGSRRKRQPVLGSVDILSLHDARDRARKALAAAREGVDLDRQERAKVAWAEDEECRKARRLTVRQAVAAYLEAFETTLSKRSGRRPASSTLRQANVWLKRLIATHGETALEDLAAQDVQAVLTATPQSSRRNVFGAIKRLAAWAQRQGLTKTSPFAEIDPPARPASRDRTPSPIEVMDLLKAADALLESGRWRQVQRDGVWLCALTAQRRAEVAAMAWEDVDLNAAEWRQPGAKNKTARAHVVPLAPRALAVVKARHEAEGRPAQGLVLPGVRGGGRMDANLSDLQQVLRQETGIAFRLHDFRRAAVSAMAERGVDFAVADMILNHAASESRGGMLAVYQRAEMKDAKRLAMEIWEGALFPRERPVVPLEERRTVSAPVKLVLTDIHTDPKGCVPVAVAEKHAERIGKGRARRRRPPDVPFDEALLEELSRRKILLALNKTCIDIGVEVARRLGKTISRDSAKTRIAELLRRSREHVPAAELTNLCQSENM
jgi:integrase